MALTNDPALAASMRKLRSHGITSTPAEMDPRPQDELWNYQQVGLGFNYRLTDIQAALGLSQMQRLDEFVAARHALARRYDELLVGLPLATPAQSAASYSSYHLYIIRLYVNEIGRTQLEVFRDLHQRKILVNLHYIPIYLQPYYRQLGFKPGLCPEAERYFKQAMSIPLYPGLGHDQQDRVIDALADVLHP